MNFFLMFFAIVLCIVFIVAAGLSIVRSITEILRDRVEYVRQIDDLFMLEFSILVTSDDFQRMDTDEQDDEVKRFTETFCREYNVDINDFLKKAKNI